MVSAALVVATALAAAAAVAWTSTDHSRRRLVRSVGEPASVRASRDAARDRKGRAGPVARVPGSEQRTSVALRVACGVLAGLATAWLTRSVWGAVPGVVVGVAAERALRRARDRRAARRRALRVSADLPAAADLLSACFHAGAEPLAAVTVVSESVGGPVGEALGRVLSLLALGADPAHAWAQLADEPGLAPLAAALGRAADTGAPLADTLSGLADDLRHVRRVQAQAAAHRVGVYAVAPLGLCFLPAFLLVGVVPVVLGMAAPMLGVVLR